ncbi:hypothetical protein ACH5RR_039688 [Cinchona calisaya]|uniref:Uncharacterized protein n=1 Tax=Cinchona calisaya TaxID=153742 RepID=A0ABD2Y318_9GENT
MGVEMHVLGGQKEFASSTLFSTDSAVSKFGGIALPSSKNFEFANLNCANGLDGRGVTCSSRVLLENQLVK